MHDTTLSQFKDIMPSIEIPINPFPWIVGLLAVAVLMLLLLHRYKRPSSSPTPQTMALQHLQALNLQGAVDKEMLYRFTLLARTYLDGREDPDFEKIQQALLPHKYHPHTAPVEKELIEEIRSYIRGLS